MIFPCFDVLVFFECLLREGTQNSGCEMEVAKVIVDKGKREKRGQLVESYDPRCDHGHVLSDTSTSVVLRHGPELVHCPVGEKENLKMKICSIEQERVSEIESCRINSYPIKDSVQSNK